MTTELTAYVNSLKQLEQSDISSCDAELLKNLIDVLGSGSADSNDVSSSSTLLVNLFVEDISTKTGPIKFPCMLVWTGKTFKQKCFESFQFPVENQTLLSNSSVVENEQTLYNAGVRRTGDILTIFLSTSTLQARDSILDESLRGNLSSSSSQGQALVGGFQSREETFSPDTFNFSPRSAT